MVEKVEFLGHATFKIKGSKTVYFDPYQLENEEQADIILITHSHFDHLSIDDLKKIVRKDTQVICSKDCVKQVEPLVDEVTGIDPYEEVYVEETRVESVPAYNINKDFHPRANNWNGYIVTLDGVRYYHPGDTDKIPEMKDVKTDVAFLPVGGTYTMDYREAAEAVELIKPKYAIPMHYGSIVGYEYDAEHFVQLVGSKGIIIPKK